MPVYQVLDHLPELGDNLAPFDRPPASKSMLERGVGICLRQLDRLDVLTDGDLAAVGEGDYTDHCSSFKAWPMIFSTAWIA